MSADITLDANGRTVTRHSESSGTKANGDTITRSGDNDRYGQGNALLRLSTVPDTPSSPALATSNRRRRFSNLRDADGDEYCPTGTIEHVNQAKARTVLATFDGSATASIAISRPKGDKAKSWTIACTPH